MRSPAEIHRLVESLQCRGLCGKDACGPFPISERDDARIRQYCRTNGVQYRSIGEHFRKTLPLVALGLLRVGDAGPIGPLLCPLLVDGRCSVYPVRPKVCRLWGAAEFMMCPHGCRPTLGPLLTREEAHLYTAR